ncbi:hypothetical protein [Paraburkholderia terrae]|uniref:hypothetical protein n=1 Tax=Paraburkholderia terrae TaxID=311230 RepID=UPI00205AC1F8|nr:hypothetical protein [Paraburkholderia terrae]BDC44266.1 hypothetical protein PTKU15_75630 [Paraburkholderia terrae]
MNPLHSRPATGTSGTSATQEAAQTQRGVTEPARQQTRARFATSLRNNVRFAHAHHAHLQGQARSANARRLAKALLKKRQGKAAATRFAATRRPTTGRSGTNARAAQNTRNTDRQRNAALRVSRDGGNGGSRGGGQQQDEQKQQQRQQDQHGKHDDDLTLDGANGTKRAAGVVPEFAAHALTLAGSSRREALASAWCDALLKPARSLHDALSQLRALRRQEGALPLASLAQVRQSLMDATARAAARRQAGEALPSSVAATAVRTNTSKEARNVLAPLLALVAGGPMLAGRERRAVSANAALDGITRARSTRPADATGTAESAS